MVINSFLIKVFGKWLQGFNHARWAIMAAHLLQMWPLGDIAYYYVKAVLAPGLNCRVRPKEQVSFF
jgi:hypothetical protein